MKKMKLTIAIIAMAALAAVGFSSCKTAKKTTEACQHLRDTKWELEALNNKPIDTNTFITHPFIVFQEDGTFSGNLGCNTYFGSYYNKKDKLQLEYSGATKRLCPVMDMERDYLNALKKDISSFSIDGNILILYAGKEEVFRFKDGGKMTEEE